MLSFRHQQTLNITATILHHLKAPCLKKKHTFISWNFKTWNCNVYIYTFEVSMKTFESDIKALSISVTIVQKKALWFFLRWRYGLSSSTTHLPYFSSCNITKSAETNPLPMRDVIIEQPLKIEFDLSTMALDTEMNNNISRNSYCTRKYLSYLFFTNDGNSLGKRLCFFISICPISFP